MHQTKQSLFIVKKALCHLGENIRGEDFREAYKESRDIVTWTEVPIHCLSATITPDMKEEILTALYLKAKPVRTISLPPDRCVPSHRIQFI